MREKSHIDDMRAAVRGDLERARTRRPSVFERPAAPPLAAAPAPQPDPVPEAEPQPELPIELPAPLPESRLRDRLAFWHR